MAEGAAEDASEAAASEAAASARDGPSGGASGAATPTAPAEEAAAQRKEARGRARPPPPLPRHTDTPPGRNAVRQRRRGRGRGRARGASEGGCAHTPGGVWAHPSRKRLTELRAPPATHRPGSLQRWERTRAVARPLRGRPTASGTAGGAAVCEQGGWFFLVRAAHEAERTSRRRTPATLRALAAGACWSCGAKGEARRREESVDQPHARQRPPNAAQLLRCCC